MSVIYTLYMLHTYVNVRFETIENINEENLFFQVICDANLMFTDVNARWPGSSHDSMVWRNSQVGASLEEVNFINPYYLLGDSGYPLRPWLLTPYMRPGNEAQRGFNLDHKKTRNYVEHAIGVLKMRFR